MEELNKDILLASKVESSWGLSDCWVFLYTVEGSLPYNIRRLEATIVLIWPELNKTELN